MNSNQFQHLANFMNTLDDDGEQDKCGKCKITQSGNNYIFQLDERGQEYVEITPHNRRIFNIPDNINIPVKTISTFLCDRCVVKDGLYKSLLIQILLVAVLIGFIVSAISLKFPIWLIVVSILIGVVLILAFAKPLIYKAKALNALISGKPAKLTNFMKQNIPPYINYESNSDYWKQKGTKMAVKIYKDSRQK